MPMRPDWPRNMIDRLPLLAAVALCGCAASSPELPGRQAGTDSSLSKLRGEDNTLLSLEGPQARPAAARSANTQPQRGGPGPWEKARLVRDAAMDVEAILKERDAAQPTASRDGASPAFAPPNMNRAADPEFEPTADAGLADAAWAWIAPQARSANSSENAASSTEFAESKSDAASKPVAPSPSADQLAADLGSRLAAILRGPSGSNSPSLAAPLAIASLEAVKPGILKELDDPASAMSKALSREDRATLLAAKDRIAADPDAPSTAAHSAAAQLSKIAPPQNLRIPKAVLCTKVQSFGKYTPFAGSNFRAGTTVRALVYTELDGFSSRVGGAGVVDHAGNAASESYTIELTQALTLFHDESGLQAWHRPAQTVTETTKAKRRDFYLVQQIELPANLSIGRYNLKVTVVDRATGATSEAAVPLSIVADPALVVAR